MIVMMIDNDNNNAHCGNKPKWLHSQALTGQATLEDIYL